jgi:hypothetical protein
MTLTKRMQLDLVMRLRSEKEAHSCESGLLFSGMTTSTRPFAIAVIYGSQGCGRGLREEGGTVAFQVEIPFPDAPQSTHSYYAW